QGTTADLILQLFYVIIWTAFAFNLPWQDRSKYTPLAENWLRIVVLIAVVAITTYQIGDEIKEVHLSTVRTDKYKKWRLGQIEEQMAVCHPCWPGEMEYLEDEKNLIDSYRSNYASDTWNFIDWITYVALVASLVSHFVDIGVQSLVTARWHARIVSMTIILVWLRILKSVRAYIELGPFIVILGKLILVIGRFIFLYLVFFIPYRYNSSYPVSVQYFDTVNDLMFSLFLITANGPYDLAVSSKDLLTF
ncbi:unnamed protein product, partial [Schistocephalus solidus]|uniref:Ion_trans domain-containing protein n=1 Tax=Schistocephalus solidus TaxID=70667 RepID=A0A183TE37_SCHSO